MTTAEKSKNGFSMAASSVAGVLAGILELIDFQPEL
jgi:hypothetical protein